MAHRGSARAGRRWPGRLEGVLAGAALFAAGACLDARPAAAAPAAPVSVVQARTTLVRTLTSPGGEIHRIWISVPPGSPPQAGFPVIYVLDGNAWFGVAAALAEAQDEDQGPVVVVGVGYPIEGRFDSRRLKHLTPTAPQEPLGLGQAGLPVGGAEGFASFLTGEVVGSVGEAVKVARNQRTLFGHSLGGLFVLHVLFTRPDAFDTYVAASPSIWWNKPAVLKAQANARFGCPAPRVLLTVGSLESELAEADREWLYNEYATKPDSFAGQTLDQAHEDLRRRTASNRIAANAEDMASALRSRGLDAQYVEFTGEDHHSVVAPALNRTMRLARRPEKAGGSTATADCPRARDRSVRLPASEG